jgi:glycosyltransferase involved in cell wall biosynthesis
MSGPRVLWLAPWYPPDHGGGAEWTAHAFNRYLIESRRARVTVLSSRLLRGQFEEVDVEPLFGDGRVRALVERADLVCTQLDHMDLAAGLARACGKPIVFFLHSTLRTDIPLDPDHPRGQFVVYNAEWVRAALPLHAPSIVIPPPVDWRRYEVPAGGPSVTMVNLRRHKGSGVFFECARRMPARPFLAVHGFTGPEGGQPELANVTVAPSVADARAIYRQTRILLMPSAYESWGRAGIEAMASGIPVIAHPTPGLIESLGDAGIFCDRIDADAWVRAIESLDDPVRYQAASEASRCRARALDPAADLERFGALVDAAIAQGRGRA